MTRALEGKYGTQGGPSPNNPAFWAGTWGLCFMLTGWMLRTVLETSFLLHFVSVFQMRSLRTPRGSMVTLLLEWYKQQSPPLAQGSFFSLLLLCLPRALSLMECPLFFIKETLGIFVLA